MALTPEDITYRCPRCNVSWSFATTQGRAAFRRGHEAAHVAYRDTAVRRGASRQAGTTRSTSAVGAVDVLQALGIAVHTGTLVPTGAAVRLDIDDTARWLEPSEARTLAVALEQAAMNAMHEDRAARRG